MKLLLVTFLLASSLLAKTLTPASEIEMGGNILDIKIVNDMLYAGTDEGTLEIYDIKNDKHLDKIKLKPIHDFMGDVISPKVYAIDVIGGKKLLLSEGEKGSRELYINENNTTVKVISAKDKLIMQKAKFIDENHLFLGLLSNEIILYDLKNKKQLYIKQLSGSKFSDFALNEDKTKAVIACESGVDYLVDVKSGKKLKEFDKNKDNVFKVDFKNGKISSAGQDRFGIVYDEKSGSHQSFKAPFLIYATGLSKDAKLAAFSFGLDNEIAVFDLEKNSQKFLLKGQKSTLNSIVFYDDKTIYSGSDDKFIIKWELKN
jgi:WD40 repeat protein